MTDLERRALLGDRQAQEECTRKRILLPCWRCGGEAEVKQVSTVGRPLFAVSCKKHYCGAYGCAHRTEKKAILYWNTRPVPPLGRCKDCENTCPGNDDSYIVCVIHGHAVNNDNWCDQFELKKPNCRGCAHWRGNEHDACAPCSDCDGVMEADNFCKNFESRKESRK